MKNTLKTNREFHTTYRKGTSFAATYVVVYALVRKNKKRVGLTVKKNFGNAVERNRAKRLMRESYRLLSPHIQSGYDIIIVARMSLKNKKCIQVFKDMEYALRKLGIYEKNTDKIN